MLTVEQAGSYLNVNKETVRVWLRNGKLRGIKMGHRTWRVPETALREIGGNKESHPGYSPEASRIISELRQGDGDRHNAAILAMAAASLDVRAEVIAASAQAAAEYYESPEGRMELADWRAIQGEPFYEDEEMDAF